MLLRSQRAALYALPIALLLGGTGASPQTPAAPAQAQAQAPVHALDPALRDTTTDPCTDFYQYSCGGWLAQHPVPADRAAYGRDTEAADADAVALRSILQRVSVPGSTGRTSDEQKTGDAYAACMNTDQIDAEGTKPLEGPLREIEGVSKKSELPPLLAFLQKQGVPGLFRFGAQQNYRDATEEIAFVGQPQLGLPEKGYYSRSDGRSAQLREDYLAHVRRSFLLLGEPAEEATRDAAAVLRVETALADASLSQEELRDPTLLYHWTPLEQFEANSPELAFRRYLKEVGAPPVASLNVAEPLFFLALHNVLEETALADLKALLRWNLLRSVPSTALPRPLDDEHFTFYGRILSGTPEQQPRWKRCARTVDAEVGESLGRLFVAGRFVPADKARTEALARSIEAAAGSDLATLPWMSAPTRAEATRKLQLVANNIGYPDRWRDYTSLRIAPGDAFGNAMRAAAFEAARDTRKIGRPVDRSEWAMTPQTVNAYYDPQKNSVNFPAGILQPPFYDPAQDDAVNYGSIGAVIGHELSHGFDDEGRRFDGQGNLRDWWRRDDAAQFAERASCVQNQYSAFVQVDGQHGNGKLTLGEDLADEAGLKLAWLAFSKTAGTLAEPGGPAYGGLTPAQQFFVAYGQSWCASTRPEALRERLRADPHAPEQMRVNGVVANLPAFAKAFQCKPGAPMAPARRCVVW